MLGKPWLVHVEHRSSSVSKGTELIRDTPLCSEVPGREGPPPDPTRNCFLVWTVDGVLDCGSAAKSNGMSEELF